MDTREIRKQAGLTQEKLAIKLGVSVQTVQRWESGKRKPSPMAQRLIDEFLKGVK